jgi:hypothetical protein
MPITSVISRSAVAAAMLRTRSPAEQKSRSMQALDRRPA